MWKRNNTEIVKPRKIDSIEASWILRLLAFFFSSRRRHTRWNCDWSSECALPIWSRHASLKLRLRLRLRLRLCLRLRVRLRLGARRLLRRGARQRAGLSRRLGRTHERGGGGVGRVRSEERRVGKGCGAGVAGGWEG